MPSGSKAGAGSSASKRVGTIEPLPPLKAKARHGRAVEFIERYCVLPKGYGAGKPMKLAKFQKAWLRKSLSNEVGSSVMEVARGNGKSSFLAAVALWALFDDLETGAPQVPIVATTVNQAIRSVYGVALAMIAKSPPLAERALIYQAIGNQRVVVPASSNGEMFPVSNDPDGLQGLDPSLAVCDEIGFMPIESWDSLLLAGGKRPRSLVVGIGTPGFDKDNALWHLRTRVHEGVNLPGFVFTEYAADEGCDLADESQWRKANPALVEGYMNINALRTAVALSPEAHFRIFRLGQWVDGVECWLGDDGRKTWDSLADPWEFDPGGTTWAGVDVALKHDSTAVVLVQRRPDGRFHAKAKIWLPQPDGRLDVSDAMRFLREVCATYDVQQIAYDPRFFDLPAQMLADEGLPMLEFPQSLERMTPAVGLAFEAIKRGELSHDGDEGFSWQVLNAVSRYNERGFTLAKSKSRDRIDSAVGLCMALSAAHLPVAMSGSNVFAAWA